jgi:hypothetical protein
LIKKNPERPEKTTTLKRSTGQLVPDAIGYLTPAVVALDVFLVCAYYHDYLLTTKIIPKTDTMGTLVPFCSVPMEIFN